MSLDGLFSLVGDAAGVSAGDKAAQAQAGANKTNANNVKNTNALNYKMFQESRGSTGNAVLPLYMQTADGKPFEGKLSQDLMGLYSKSQVPFADYKAAAARTSPMEAGAESTANGIFNGGVQSQMQKNFAPVAGGRVAFTRQSAMDSLSKTLSQIDAAQAARGFTGDSLGNRMVKFGANKQAGDAMAGVNIQNLNDTRSIEDQALQLRLANLSLPTTMASQATNLLSMPTTAATSNANQSMLPLNFVRLGGGQPYVNQNMPMVGAIPGAGQLAMEGIGQAAGQASNSYFQNKLNTYMKGLLNPNQPAASADQQSQAYQNLNGGSSVLPPPASSAASNATGAASDYFDSGGGAVDAGSFA